MATLYQNVNKVQSVHSSDFPQGRQLKFLMDTNSAFGIELTTLENFQNVLTDLQFYQTSVSKMLVWITSSEAAYFPYIQNMEMDYDVQTSFTFWYLRLKNLLV